MAVTFESFQSYGTAHSAKHLLKMMVMGNDSSDASSHRVRARILSGPHALSGFRALILFDTVSISTVIFDKGGPSDGSSLGSEVGNDVKSSQVKHVTNL